MVATCYKLGKYIVCILFSVYVVCFYGEINTAIVNAVLTITASVFVPVDETAM